MAPPKSKDSVGAFKHSRDKGDVEAPDDSPPKRRRIVQATGNVPHNEGDSSLDVTADGDDTTVGSSPPSADLASTTEVNDGGSSVPSTLAGQKTAPRNDAATDNSLGAEDMAVNNTHLVFTRRQWFSNALMQRLPPMLDYQKPAENIFALSRLPVLDLDWGNSTASANKLCIKPRSVPVSVWIIGIIDALWLFNPRSGEPEARISVGVAPLADHALMVARNVLCDFSRPVSTSAKSLFHVNTSKWTSTQVHGERANQNQEFEKVYDARNKFVTKNKMTRLAPEELKKNDLVLMEAQISRYNTRKDRDGKVRTKTNKADMVEYKVSFDLVAVSLLEVGPKLTEDAAAELGPDDEGF